MSFDKYCVQCGQILSKVYQLSCGHRICDDCSNESQGSGILCSAPDCQELSKDDQPISDRSFNHELKAEQINCRHCNWNGSYFSYREHRINDHSDTTCSFCKRVYECVEAVHLHQIENCQEYRTSSIYQLILQNFQQSKDKIKTELSNGTLHWEIDGLQEKLNAARDGLNKPIYSQPFLTSRNGYKMCACIYLNGDDMADRTYMSLHVVLMRGPNDDQLEFPFDQTVIFCLFDQTNGRNHIIKSFHPNTKSESVRKPQTEMNPSSGIPKFVSLSMIQQTNNHYVKDDTLFIKVRVYPRTVPQNSLKLACILDPDLPMNIQEQTMAIEIRKHDEHNRMEEEEKRLRQKIEALESQKTNLLRMLVQARMEAVRQRKIIQNYAKQEEYEIQSVEVADIIPLHDNDNLSIDVLILKEMTF